MLGLVSRLGAALGLAMALNLWLGLYRAPGEWPWTYVFLIIIQLLFVLHRPGRSLGLDAILLRRPAAQPAEGRSRMARLLT
jgi:quinol-cytochrome oxidoreductase complex cytochrome b subunit